jgi:hypothetical protein
MTVDDPNLIRIAHDELFRPEVDQAMERARVQRRRLELETPSLSPLRRLLMSSGFYLPAAALVGVLAAYLIIEPHFHDMSIVGGQVTTVEEARFVSARGAVEIGIPGLKLLALSPGTRLEAGTEGEAAFATLADVRPGAYVEAAVMKGEDRQNLVMSLRRASPARALAAGTEVEGDITWAKVLFFPMTGTFICFMLLLAEGLSTRNWRRMIPRTLGGSLLACVFSFVAYLPAGLILMLSGLPLKAEAQEHQLVTVLDLAPWPLLAMIAGRSAAWACIAAAAALALNIIKGTRLQIRNAVLGGLIGGAIGGMFFDPLDRFFRSSLFDASSASRLVGLLAVGLSVGFFVALVERLAREAWILVRNGPLAGKAFVLYRTPTSMGSSPQADIFLYRDEELQPVHALIHRVGQTFELHAQGEAPVLVGGDPVRSRRLQSGDQILIGKTLLQFEERAKRPKTG